MPNAIVWHGFVYTSPQLAELTPAGDTKIARARSPSMPSQLLSTYIPSGSSVADGGWHAPQPVAPVHVWDPMQTFHGVMMLQGCIAPGFAAVQSHAPLAAMHCLKFVPPTLTVSQL